MPIESKMKMGTTTVKLLLLACYINKLADLAELKKTPKLNIYKMYTDSLKTRN